MWRNQFRVPLKQFEGRCSCRITGIATTSHVTSYPDTPVHQTFNTVPHQRPSFLSFSRPDPNPEQGRLQSSPVPKSTPGAPFKFLLMDGDAPETHYTHQPLSEAERHIRLLTLLPGNSLETGEPLRGSLRHVSLAEKPQYRALSYSWGKPTLHCPFLIEDRPFLITDSLRGALAHIQHGTQPLTLWIDQICINQGDKLEKSWQVQMMKQIYESAKEVFVWLGPDKDRARIALQQLQDLGKVVIEENVVEGPTTKLPANEYLRLMVDRATVPEDCSLNRLLARIHEFPVDKTAIVRLYSRSWWQRVWVIQEFVSNAKTTFVVGTERADADEVIAGVAILHIARRGLTMWRQAFDYKKLTDAGLDKFPRFEPQAMVMTELRRMWTQKRRWNIDQLLIFCWRGCFRATDPRDFIFGIYGLADESDVPNVDIKADYTKGTIKTYVDATAALLKGGYHAILSEAQWRRYHWHAPSWVPDYAAGVLARGDTEAYHRSQELSDSIRIEGRLAHFRGVRVSKLAHVLAVFPPPKAFKVRRWMKREAKPAAELAYETAPSNYGSLEAAEQAIYQAAVCASYRVISDKEYAGDSMPTMAEFEEFLTSGDKATSMETTRKVNWWKDVAFFGAGTQLSQSVILTADGWFGLGYSLEPGEYQVVMLDGFSKPVILRKAESGNWRFSRGCTFCVPEGKEHIPSGPKETFTVE
ncbi:HET-domain-containing protein [Zalerion maritima]|uniref:HET-domain-containing protein n=1 Tax=Zalerion maritima TaxID=339359 RepID=A0AAD5WW43_9PEZI|nr:HET-domain-containing protein [Zalerion maritima]